MPGRKTFSLLLAAFALITFLGAPPATAGTFSATQEQAIQEVVRNYLKEHPEVLVEAIQSLREQQQQAEEHRAREALEKNREELTHNPDSPVGGNPDGDVTIVEFFDYQCGYCKRVLPVLRDFVKKDGNVRLVFKEFPILSRESLTAARAALAVAKMAPAKYVDFHVDLMNMKGAPDIERIMTLAERHGIDRKELTGAMGADWINAEITRNRQLAEELGITGTPAFIIGDQLVPGALDAEVLAHLTEQARKR